MSTVDFVLQRSPGSEAEELGLRLYFQPPAPDVAGICLVNGISESGLVAERNSECAAGQQLQVGDELLLVNGRSEQGELSKELHSALFLQIRARRRAAAGKAAKTEPLRTQSGGAVAAGLAATGLAAAAELDVDAGGLFRVATAYQGSGEPELGYLESLVEGDLVVVQERTRQPGSGGNQYQEYVFGRRSDPAAACTGGWLPSAVLGPP